MVRDVLNCFFLAHSHLTEDGGIMFHRNGTTYLDIHTTLQPNQHRHGPTIFPTRCTTKCFESILEFPASNCIFITLNVILIKQVTVSSYNVRRQRTLQCYLDQHTEASRELAKRSLIQVCFEVPYRTVSVQI
jgi:hypothetical protein